MSCDYTYMNVSDFYAVCAVHACSRNICPFNGCACYAQFILFLPSWRKTTFFFDIFNVQWKKVANLLVDVYPGKNCSRRASVVFSEPMKIKIHRNWGQFRHLRYLMMDCNLGISFPFVGMCFLVTQPQIPPARWICVLICTLQIKKINAWSCLLIFTSLLIWIMPGKQWFLLILRKKNEDAADLQVNGEFKPSDNCEG